MFRLLNFLFAFSFAFCWTKEELSAFVERQVKERFGEDVRVNKVILLNWDGKGEGVPKVELDMEYGKVRAFAYLQFEGNRYTAVIDALWRAKLLRAKKDIKKGELLSAELFDVEERWLKSIPKDLLIDPKELKDYRASTDIPKGSILRRSVMKPSPAVNRGDIVKVIFRSGNIQIEGQGTSLDVGYVGKVVRIKTSGGKLLRGKVIDRGVVEVLD
ncbi:flagellar basal body P-ring formation chaperone FlgA [Thermocrinis sp.]|jgi:flagella basal body P-ring formation protein FlgA|uniref:flagellar basal body P-ring formation chaperone FlgA n=1 Tax=Thermocrinis sp. TaxID=2024383 RepID=UPI0026162E34|nr:flagellar basal body P-ring formation chaperone FlgA [Thermocrinis sp.]